MQIIKIFSITLFIIGLFTALALPDSSQTAMTNNNLMDAGTLMILFSVSTLLFMFWKGKKTPPIN